MSEPRDDDALRWEGDDDPTLAPGWRRVGATNPVDESSVDAAVASNGDHEQAASAPRQAGSFELVAFGIFGGIYLLYSVGWLVTLTRTGLPGTSLVGDFMYQLGLWAAVLAAPAWFAVTVWLTRHARTRVLWLVLGAILLVPLPFVIGELPA